MNKRLIYYRENDITIISAYKSLFQSIIHNVWYSNIILIKNNITLLPHYPNEPEKIYLYENK